MDLWDQVIGATTIAAAETAQGSGRYLVTPSYADGDSGAVTFSEPDCYVEIGPGVVVSQDFNFSGANATLELGPNCNVGDLNFSGANPHIIVHNGATYGRLIGTATADNIAIYGRGFGAVGHMVELAGSDVVVDALALDAKTPAAGERAMFFSGGPGRGAFRLLKILGSDIQGFFMNDRDYNVHGCTIEDADLTGFHLSEGGTLTGCHGLNSTNEICWANVGGSDSIICGNYFNTSHADGFELFPSISDVVNNCNRVPAGITDTGAAGTNVNNNVT